MSTPAMVSKRPVSRTTQWPRVTDLNWRTYLYTAATGAAAVLAVWLLGGFTVVDDVAYGPIACAVLVGLLLTVRLAPGLPVASLVLLPALVMAIRFGSVALLAVAFVAVVANLVRGVRGPRVLSTASHTVLAFAAGSVAVTYVTVVPNWLAFSVSFALVRLALWHLADRIDRAPIRGPVEKPNALLALVLAPVGMLPLLAYDRLGDGALLLALASVLALLFVVREAANLTTLRAETELERDRLQRANALQDDLIHLITHELRNPLTLVMSYSQMARRAAIDGNVENLPTYIGQVERAGRSIQRLMENMLQLSKLERSDGLPPPESIDTASIINQVVVDLSGLAKQKQQTLRVQPAARDVPHAMAVPLLLREALSNLVSNAVKYTPEGGQITVWAERGARPATVTLGVRDTGIGLSEDDRERLFTKFFRSSDPRVQRERGSGLGLALTNTMVRRMGGDIAVESALGEGTTFRLTVPASPE